MKQSAPFKKKVSSPLVDMLTRHHQDVSQRYYPDHKYMKA